ncbi:MAG: AMP-binding protein [Cyanobacteria bacterium J06626_14]
MLITDGLVRYGDAHPGKLAICIGRVHCTYGQLLQSVRCVAAAITALSDVWRSGDGLTERHLRPCVAVLLPNSVEFLEVFLGTTTAGGVAMVLNPDWPPAQIQAILERWKPDVLVTQSSLLGLIGVSNERPVPDRSNYGYFAEDCPSFDAYCRQKQSGSQSIRAIALYDSPSQSDCTPHLTYPHTPEPTNLNQLCQKEGHRGESSTGQRPFYIGFTSGTTGFPKGVIRSHASWVKSFEAGQIEFGLSSEAQIFVPGAFVHSLSLYAAVETLVNGATLHGFFRLTPKAMLQCLTQQPITRIVGVPALLKAIAQTMSRKQLSLPTVRTIISGGSKLRPDLRDQLQACFPLATLFEYYGASELSFMTVASSLESVPVDSVGRAFHGVEVSVRRDDGMAASPKEIGWIGIHSEMVCSGYLEKTDDGTGFQVKEGWATVGDRGWLDEAGYLYLAGRERDMLICNGVNVYPAEIEAVLMTHPEIEDAVVIGIPDDCRGDIICAVLKMKVQAVNPSIERSNLIAYLRQRLEPEKCPRRFFLTDDLPMTTGGKVSRVDLKQQIMERSPNLLVL